jgi:ferredoxin
VLVVTIDRDRCMGSGMCTFHAPDTFDLDEESRSVIIDPALSDVEGIETAAATCPTEAITVEHPE